ncbi:MAG TPA: alkene reductase, partial [Chroococcales cyanobacterium]
GDMGSADNHEAFLYFAKQLDKYNLGFLHVLRVPKDFIPFHGLGKEVQLLEWRDVYSGTIMANGGYGSVAEAQSALDAGEADLVAIGRPFITNPDLVERLKNNLPLASWQDSSVFYGFDSHNYTDFTRALHEIS